MSCTYYTMNASASDLENKYVKKEYGEIYDVDGILFGATRNCFIRISDGHMVSGWVITMLLNGYSVGTADTKSQIVSCIKSRMPGIKEWLRSDKAQGEIALFCKLVLEEVKK